MSAQIFYIEHHDFSSIAQGDKLASKFSVLEVDHDPQVRSITILFEGNTYAGIYEPGKKIMNFKFHCEGMPIKV